MIPPSGTPITNQPTLKRALGLVSLTFYGLGGILGAGIYALIGEVAGSSGTACWLAFLVSFCVASLTGLTYCELGTRFPKSAGESVYALAAFRKQSFSYLIGFFVCLSGVVSTGALSHAFAGYAHNLWAGVPPVLWMIGFMVSLTLITLWGIKESSWFNIICTLIEGLGIVIVIAAGMKYLGSVNYLSFPESPAAALPAVAVLNGAMLAFYAFIGFEDIVNVAEETHQPSVTIPWAILISLGISAVLYILTALVAVSAVPAAELAASKAPLLQVVQKGWPWVPVSVFTLIALFAISNSTLINFIMSSRLLYGMSREGLLPGAFGKIHPKFRTPHWSILFILAVSLALAMTGGLQKLAGATSFLLLVVFTVMNVSLIIIKRRDKNTDMSFSIPSWIPYAGALTSTALVLFVDLDSLTPLIILFVLGLALFLFQKVVNRFSRKAQGF